ncbi:MAG: ABC transporter permease [Anaerolineales bacterium]
MKPLEILSVAWEGLLTNKLRTLLTMLGVIIGVGAVIMMLAVSAGAQAIVADQIKGLGTNLIFVTPNFTRGGPGGGGSDTFLTMDDVSAIEAQVPGVTGVSTERDASETVRAGSVTLSGVSIVGTTADYPTVRSVGIASGRFFTAQEVTRGTKVAVLGPSLAESLFGSSNPIGQTILVGNAQLTVIGVTASKGTVGNVDYDSQLYTSLTVVNQRFLPSRLSRIFGSRVSTIFIKVADGTSMDQTIFQTQVLLAKAHNVSLTELPFNVQTQQDVIQTQTATTAAFRALLAWVAAVSLLVGGIGIMNIMLVSVTERTREIGIRQAIGATPTDVRLQFLTEALLLSLVGGALGALGGVGGAWALGRFGSFQTVIVPWSILLAFVSAAAVGIVFGYFPANSAAKLDPIQALRYE